MINKRCLQISVLGIFCFYSIASLAADTALTPSGPTVVPLGSSTTPATNTGGSANSILNNNQTPSTPAQPAPLPVATGISAPAATPTPSDIRLGQFRNADGTVRIGQLLLNRYKNSVVRVRALDQDGNELGRAMGVSIGRPPYQYIATPLSLILGNHQQWADKIELTHNQGNRYYAKIALVNEALNLVLLQPEVFPAPMIFGTSEDERPQIEVYTISFGDIINGVINSKIHKGTLSAVNTEQGMLSIASQEIDSQQYGTAIINSRGVLVGMLLPDGQGILASMLQRNLRKAQDSTSIDPRMLGVIMGRGVLVDPEITVAQKSVFKTITEALNAIQKNEAPSIDLDRFLPAKNRQSTPKPTDKLVLKLMPGTYREVKPIYLPSNLSLSGSGAKTTSIIGPADHPAIVLSEIQNTIIAGIRLVPASPQKETNPAILINKSNNITLLGNQLEAKGGISVFVQNSENINILANSFPNGKSRAIECTQGNLLIGANAFLGNWDIGVNVGKNCKAQIKRNLFLQNRISILNSAFAKEANIESNSIIKSTAGIKVAGLANKLSINDNLFYDNNYGFLSANEPTATTNFGRNSVWKSPFIARNHAIKNIDIIRTEPVFENPAHYDFRVKLGHGQIGAAAISSGYDLGAYQRTDFLGEYTTQYIHSLESATGEGDLVSSWGYQE